MLRLLLLGLFLYLVFKVLGAVVKQILTNPQPKVRGEKKGNPPLNLDDYDVEDADFEEIK